MRIFLLLSIVIQSKVNWGISFSKGFILKEIICIIPRFKVITDKTPYPLMLYFFDLKGRILFIYTVLNSPISIVLLIHFLF